MASSFTVFEKFGDVCACLEEADRKELIYAINMYGMFGETVELPYSLAPIFVALKEDIDNSKESRRRGASGGRPKSVSEDAKPPVSATGKPPVSESDKPPVPEGSKPPVSEDAKHPVSEKSEKTESQTKPNQAKPSQTKCVGRFAPPTLAEVRAYAADYCLQKNLATTGFIAERFVDYYTSNGWKVGRNPMKDWKAAVREWVRRDCKGVGGDEYSAL